MGIKTLIKKNYFLYNILACIRLAISRFKSSHGGGNVVIDNSFGKICKDVIGNNNTITLGSNSFFHKTRIRIRGNNNRIIFGENCSIGSNCSFWMEGNNISIIIGDNTTFTHSVHFCAQEDNQQIIVGDDCMFSNTITVRTSDSHPIYNEVGIRINEPRSVYIGKHVWIAPGAKIMKGAKIMDGAIIGSNTFVTKEILENSLAVGSPAKVVKMNVHWTREQIF